MTDNDDAIPASFFAVAYSLFWLPVALVVGHGCGLGWLISAAVGILLGVLVGLVAAWGERRPVGWRVLGPGQRFVSLRGYEDPGMSEEEQAEWDAFTENNSKEAALEEQGQGQPHWNLDQARRMRPDLSPDQQAEWVRVANEEYRRLRLERVAQLGAESQSWRVADQRFPTVASDG